MEYSFFNKRSETIYNKLIKNDKTGQFVRYFDDLKRKRGFYSSNGIPDNCFLSLCAFQAIDFYLKYDKKQMRKIFNKFAKLASHNNETKYIKLISETNKIVDEMLANKYTISSNTMHDFEFEVNQDVIKSIKIFLDVIGTGIYRMGYNIYLQDEYYYKYWQITTMDFKNLLEIKKAPLINKGKIVFHDGNHRKSQELIKFQKMVKDNIYKFIKRIAPGLFVSLYKSIPIIMVLEIDLISYYTKIAGSMFKITNHEKELNSSFWEIIRNDGLDGLHEFYYNRTYSDMYIPTLINDYNNPIIFSKHFRNPGAFTPTNLLFVLEILSIFYKSQLNISNNLKNKYLFSFIKSKTIFLSSSRKRLYKIDALIKLLNDAFNVEKCKFENPYDDKLKYYLNNSYEHEIEYFDSLINGIDYNSKVIDGYIPDLKDIYDKAQNDRNILSNTVFQIIGLILAIFMAMQTIQQCTNPKQENKEKNGINNSGSSIIVRSIENQ
jgi:hypothetical protein